MPTVPQGIPGNAAGFDWNLVNYAPLTVGGAFVLFGGWWIISAHRWFKGPIRQGDEAELERIEAQYERGRLIAGHLGVRHARCVPDPDTCKRAPPGAR